MEHVLLCIDIDGVFNPHRLLKDKEEEITHTSVHYLNRILEAVPNCRVLISSAWGYSAVPHLKTAGFRYIDRIVGSTIFDTSDERGIRTKEIIKWLEDNKRVNRHFSKVVALDDEPDLFEYHDHLYGVDRANSVFVRGDIGLDEKAAYEVVCKLLGHNFRCWA